jgi:hypothetical protein
MADEIFQKAWGHYLDLINFLAEKPGPVEGVLQPFNLSYVTVIFEDCAKL